MKKIIIVLVIIFALSLILSGCGTNSKNDTGSDEQKTSGDTRDNNQDAQVKLPKAYPIEVVPLMQGYSLEDAKNVNDKYFQVTYKVDKGFEDVKAFYANLLPDVPKDENTDEIIYKYGKINDSVAINDLTITKISAEETKIFIYVEVKN